MISSIFRPQFLSFDCIENLPVFAAVPSVCARETLCEGVFRPSPVDRLLCVACVRCFARDHSATPAPVCTKLTLASHVSIWLDDHRSIPSGRSVISYHLLLHRSEQHRAIHHARALLESHELITTSEGNDDVEILRRPAYDTIIGWQLVQIDSERKRGKSNQIECAQ